MLVQALMAAVLGLVAGSVVARRVGCACRAELVAASCAGCASFAALLVRYGMGVQLLELWGLCCVLLHLSLVDLHARAIPNACVVLALCLRLAYLALSCVLGSLTALRAAGYLLGGVAVGLALLAVVLACDRLLGRASMGGGDLKLYAVCACYVGWQQAVLLVMLSCLLGLAWAAATRGTKADSGPAGTFALGPAIAAACVLTLLVGERVIGWYAGLLAG